MSNRVGKRKMQTYFNKWKICKTERDILRIKTSVCQKFNVWVVPCFTNDAVCIKHGTTEFESILVDDHILLSAYIYPQQFIDLLKIFADDVNTHLITPIYFQTLGKDTTKWLDSGISINGKCKEGEEYIDTMKREIAEEVGILVEKPATKSGINLSSFDGKFGIFYARDSKPFSSKDKIKFSDEKDCPRKKIFSYIIGSFEECKDLVKNSRELHPSTESNYGVAVIPIRCVLNLTYISQIVSKY